MTMRTDSKISIRASRIMAGILCAGLLGSSACATDNASPPQPSRKSALAQLPPAGEVAPPMAALPRPTVVERIPDRVTPDADFRQETPAPTTPPPFTIPKPQRFQLPNGLQVIVVSDHRVPLVHLQLVVRSGAASNPADKPGLAELTANMLDEGTMTRPALQLATEIEQLGATLDTSADWNSSSVSLSVLRQHLDRALPIWAEVATAPAFEAAELDRVRDNLIATLKQRQDSPVAVSEQVFRSVLYPHTHAFSSPLDGTESSVATITRDDLKNFHARNYRPNNAFLVVAGDIDEATLRTQMAPLLAPLFTTWKRGSVRRASKVTRSAPRHARIFLADQGPGPQSSIQIGALALPRKHPDYEKAIVASEILGGTFKRLDMNLREKRGWTYGVRSRFATEVVGGHFQVRGEFVSERTVDSVREILDELNTLTRSPVPAAELEEAKSSIVRAFPARFSTVRQTAAVFTELALHGLSDKDLEQFQTRVAAVTAKDVQAMATKYMDPRSVIIAVVGDAKAHRDKLGEIATVEIRTGDGAVAAGSPPTRSTR